MNTLVKNIVNNGRFVPRTYADLLDGFFNDSISDRKIAKYIPSADVSEDEKSYFVQVSIPGLKKEDIKIDLNDGILSISGERKFQNEEQGKKYHSVESYYGSFKRSFKLPENANIEAIEAEYKEGILSVTLPKQEGKQTRTSIVIK